MRAKLFAFAISMIAFAGCTNVSATNVNASASCAPSDQDQYVYRPARLQVIAPCVQVTGTIVEISLEADGDYHIQLRLDLPYRGLVNPGNEQEHGNLIVEPVCQIPPPQADAIRLCAANPDPLSGPMPRVGDHVWMEGRHVLDLQHYSWAELHPLYRWGIVNP